MFLFFLSFFQWVGFLISFTFCWILAAILFFGHSRWLGEQEPEPEQGLTEPANVAEHSVTEHIKKLPAAVKKLLTNVTYVLIILFLAFDGAIISSLATFLPKYSENQYQITPSTSAMVVGAVSVVTVIIGALLG